MYHGELCYLSSALFPLRSPQASHKIFNFLQPPSHKLSFSLASLLAFETIIGLLNLVLLRLLDCPYWAHSYIVPGVQKDLQAV